MKAISLVGWSYLVFGMATCGYFCTAAIGGWPAPAAAAALISGGSSGPRSTYYGGGSRSSTYGRSWGGSWGGGK